MDDLRENVITLLDEMRMFADLKVHEIVSPDNWNVYAELCDMIDKAKDDALSLLKEQEEANSKVSIPVEETYRRYKCGKCGNTVLLDYTFCHKCGKEIDWNGRN